MKPILRWVGGKTRLLHELRARMPATFGRYYEPFAGGAALFFDLEPKRAVLGDANADLIACYRALARDIDGVLEELDGHAHDHARLGVPFFTEMRRAWNDHDRITPWTDTERAAAFLYLNRACFNGLWRVNQRGQMNAPIGRRAGGHLNDVTPDVVSLRAAARALARAELRAGHYRETVFDATRGDVVYFDSPYVPVTKTANFTAYAAGGFGSEDQRDLAGLVRELAARGVHVLVSNSDAPLVRDLYDGLRIDVVRCGRSVGASAASRAAVNEVIVTAFPRVVRGLQLEIPVTRRRRGRKQNPAQCALFGAAP